uniref:Uncharacterized protein n=1 Tax=Arundo donax TaxID=35708 RepID=A0A0A9B998_ARUDO
MGESGGRRAAGGDAGDK